MVSRFLLVSLNINAILEEVTISARREKLHEMTKGNHSGDGYAATLARIGAQKGSRSRLGIEALMWVSNSERPLSASELCHALGVKIGSADLDLENVPEIRTILGCSLGLITVEVYTSTVRLVHLTLQEYLSGNPSLFQNPHSMIAEVCLTYLNFRCVLELQPTLSSAPPTLPLVGYASRYWGKHIGSGRAESVILLALQLLVGFENHISSRLLWPHDHSGIYLVYGVSKGGSPKGFTGLHMAASLGIVDIVAPLLVMRDWNINARDILGRTALSVAAVRGHEVVVKLLFERKDINPNIADTTYGQTPLFLAAEGGHDGVVRLLLEREDINPNTADTFRGRTPLWLAAGGRHEGIAKLLLERDDTDPNTADTDWGRTPLWLAAKGGYEGIIKLLLEREDINPNTADTSCGRTPLWLAAGGRYEGIVKLLLEREDIIPNTADADYGQTPLMCAAEEGHEAVVKLLLEREDINPNAADTHYGRTPLWSAAKGMRE